MTPESLAALYPTMTPPAMPEPAPIDQPLLAKPQVVEGPAAKPSAAPTPSIVPAGEGSPARGNVPEHIAELRKADSKLYTAESRYSSLEWDNTFFSNTPDMPPQARAEFRSELSAMFNDIGLPPEDARYAMSMGRHFAKSPPSSEKKASMQEEATRMLKEAFGDDHAALKDARLLAKRDPRLLNILEHTNLGNDGRMLVRLTHLARQQIGAGRLKREKA